MYYLKLLEISPITNLDCKVYSSRLTIRISSSKAWRKKSNREKNIFQRLLWCMRDPGLTTCNWIRKSQRSSISLKPSPSRSARPLWKWPNRARSRKRYYNNYIRAIRNLWLVWIRQRTIKNLWPKRWKWFLQSCPKQSPKFRCWRPK